jgi:hypothetical protein
MKIFKVAVKDDDYDKMKDWFETRTKKHIGLVEKYAKKIHAYDSDKYKGILRRMDGHDQSKFKSPELEPYIYTTWKYKCKDDGVDFECPKEMEDKMTEATEHHILNNSHHPEFHCGQTENLINTDDRDKPPEEQIDATKMPDLDIAEMVADWCGVSDERGSSPKTWADNNVNVRWKFTDDQKDLIYELIDAVWKK